MVNVAVVVQRPRQMMFIAVAELCNLDKLLNIFSINEVPSVIRRGWLCALKTEGERSL